ncbi:MAG: hypothetical protein A2648_02390 [Candidatus Lloydbacteria bacterium RIFCSPHIGHO2_01_FULL_41_20]|uniref:Uncharacterized protein n=1 Tax=Candidatus Lloydbacteria bacterium RIFCSPHIGHO2_01_FULL_41_20 TaxID=1798657 RepID=A0A1G2CSR1_9BACT|nr:MAG: hypothetical protein A2648_02390 [Candidatus Lloydbacteria bacterium RIFCSPHIGHO2_01_FULL_41_20]
MDSWDMPIFTRFDCSYWVGPFYELPFIWQCFPNNTRGVKQHLELAVVVKYNIVLALSLCITLFIVKEKIR